MEYPLPHSRWQTNGCVCGFDFWSCNVNVQGFEGRMERQASEGWNFVAQSWEGLLDSGDEPLKILWANQFGESDKERRRP